MGENFNEENFDKDMKTTFNVNIDSKEGELSLTEWRVAFKNLT